MSVEYKILPASAGAKWISQSTTFALTHPKPLILTIICCFIAASIMGLLSAIPLIGRIVDIGISLMTSAIAFGMFSVFRGIDQGERLSLDLFLRPIRERLKPLLICGGLYVLSSFVLMKLIEVTMSFLSKSPAVLFQYAGADSLAVANLLGLLGSTLLSILLDFILIALFIIAFTFAPPLIGWRRVSALEAIRLSFFSCLKNWKALSVNGGLWLLIVLGIGAVLGLFMGMIGTSLDLPRDFVVAMFLLIYVLLLFIPFFFGCANTYYSYKAIFPQEEEIPIE
jgi:hypothetical protein